MISKWIYDDKLNEARQTHGMADGDMYTVVELPDGETLMVSGPTGESMILKNMTPQQMVIIFDSVLALRDQAKEEA